MADTSSTVVGSSDGTKTTRIAEDSNNNSDKPNLLSRAPFRNARGKRERAKIRERVFEKERERDPNLFAHLIVRA